MEKTLTQLGLEYLDAAQKMDCLIRKCTKELKEATERRDYRACLLLKQKRLCFYSQKNEWKYKSEHLNKSALLRYEIFSLFLYFVSSWLSVSCDFTFG